MRLSVAALFALLLPAFCRAAHVEASFNGRPFDYRTETLETNQLYTVYRLVYPSPQPPSFPEATNVVAYYFKPNGLPAGKRQPAVLCLHILGGGGDITRMIASYFAERGMPAMMPIMPLFLDRLPRGGRMSMLAGKDGPRILGESFTACPGDIRRSLDVLVSFPEVDAGRINLIGTSLGGILAVSTAGADDRIQKSLFMLAGGDLKGILSSQNHEVQPIAEAIGRANAEERKRIEEAFEKVEPMNYVARLAPKANAGRIRMVNAGNDEIIPAENSRCLAGALGLREGAGLTILPSVGHYTAIVALPRLLEETAAFFGGDALKPLPPRKVSTDSEVISRVFTEINRLVSWEPAAGKEYRLGAKLDVTHDGQTTFSSFASLRRGPDQRFYFSTEKIGFKGVDALRFGRNGPLWIESRKGNVFQGDADTKVDFGERLSPKFRMIRSAMILMTALVAQSGSMQSLEKFVKLTLETAPDGSRKVAITEKKRKFRAEVTLDPKRDVPTGIFYQKGGDDVRLVFTDWNTDAAFRPEDFAPAADASRRVVDAKLLEEVLAAALNFGLAKGGVK